MLDVDRAGRIERAATEKVSHTENIENVSAPAGVASDDSPTKSPSIMDGAFKGPKLGSQVTRESAEKLATTNAASDATDEAGPVRGPALSGDDDASPTP